MKRNIFFLCLIGLLIWGACKDDDPPPEGFSSICPRDLNGVVSGSCDTRDWKFYTGLSQQEEDLLRFPDTVQFAGLSPQASFQEVVVYPNPAALGGKVFFEARGATDLHLKAKAALVNENYEPLIRFNELLGASRSRGVQLDFSDTTRFPAGIYRIYYQLIFKDGTTNIGWGDVQIQ